MNALAALPHPFYEVNNKCDARPFSPILIYRVFASFHRARRLLFRSPFFLRLIVKNFEFGMLEFKNFNFFCQVE